MVVGNGRRLPTGRTVGVWFWRLRPGICLITKNNHGKCQSVSIYGPREGQNCQANLKHHTPFSKLPLLYSGILTANGFFILVHFAMYSELHRPTGLKTRLFESQSSYQGSLKSAR